MFTLKGMRMWTVRSSDVVSESGHGQGRCTGSQEAMGKGGELTAGLDCRHPADKCGRSECRTGGRTGPQ